MPDAEQNRAVTVNQVDLIEPPIEGEPFQHEVSFNCDSCSVEKVFVNGIPLDTSLRRNTVGSFGFYVATPSTILVRFTEYSPTYEGVYQAQFAVEGEIITKNIFEIGNGDQPPEVATTAAPEPSTAKPDAKTKRPKTETEGPKRESEEPKIETEGPTTETEGPKTETEGPKPETEEKKTETEEPKTETEEPKIETEEPKKETEGPKVETEEPKTETTTISA